jgi:hypothetical protein
VIPEIGEAEAVPSEVYRNRSERFGQERDWGKRRLRRLINGRLLAFLAAGSLIVAGGAREDPRWPIVLAGIAFFLVFVALVVAHRRVTALVNYTSELKRVNDEMLARLVRNWDGFVEPPVRQPSVDHPYAEDLGLLGPASVFKLICTAATPLGQGTLRDWLLEPADPLVVLDRQAAVAELKEQIDLRDDLVARGRLMGKVRRSVLDRFVQWSQGERWILERHWLIGLAWLLPISTVVLVILQVTGVIPYYLWLFTVLGCAVVARRTGGVVRQAFDSASSGQASLRRLSGQFEIVSAASFRSPSLVTIARRLNADGVPAFRQMRRLERILVCSELRLSDLLHGLVQLLSLWDLHVLFRLERWREANRHYVTGWFSAYGEFEALSSLAGLAHSHPEWAFPEFVSDGERKLDGKDLGHPLLPPHECVTNAVQLGPPGEFLLLTGSNMSGKSTLLRAIGVNVVLAQAGGPVCATKLQLPPTRLFTAMYVHDSLEDGISQFMAALNRLKLVVDAARDAEADNVTFTYLLDEILQGTNAAERQTAVRRIERHMLAKGAIGAISTHDLTLADTADLRVAARPMHFQETIEQTATGPSLSFDYELRPGLATSTNALRLMDIVGL